MRVGIFGGTFDPPHLGHSLGALWALESGEVDHVLMIPVGSHAFGKQPAASFTHRVAMCELAIKRLSAVVSVSMIEDRPGTSYMADTLEALASERPDDTFRLILGSDAAALLSKWHRAEDVIRMAPPLIMPRPSKDGEVIEGALPEISSTAVREALALGKEPVGLLSHSVYQYIQTHGLYR